MTSKTTSSLFFAAASLAWAAPPSPSLAEPSLCPTRPEIAFLSGAAGRIPMEVTADRVSGGFHAAPSPDPPNPPKPEPPKLEPPRPEPPKLEPPRPPPPKLEPPRPPPPPKAEPPKPETPKPEMPKPPVPPQLPKPEMPKPPVPPQRPKPEMPKPAAPKPPPAPSRPPLAVAGQPVANPGVAGSGALKRPVQRPVDETYTDKDSQLDASVRELLNQITVK